MNIGSVTLANNIMLGPMAGVTDLPFRMLCKEYGCGLVYTEMVSAKGMLYENKHTHVLLDMSPDERPVAVQIFGSEPDVLAAMAKRLDAYPFDIIDINMGCPAPKIVKNGEGSALMKNPALVGRIVEAVVSQTSKPVTVKIRKGFDSRNVNAVEVAKTAEAAGAAAVAVHGRTREQYYGGTADWNIIGEVKAALKIPVIGNGDIFSPEAAAAMLKQTGCDGVMVARGALGNPWIFGGILRYLQYGVIEPPPSIEERLRVAMKHFDRQMEYKGEHLGLLEMRKHLSWYTKGLPNSAEIRVRLNSAATKDEVVGIFQKLQSDFQYILK